MADYGYLLLVGRSPFSSGSTARADAKRRHRRMRLGKRVLRASVAALASAALAYFSFDLSFKEGSYTAP